MKAILKSLFIFWVLSVNALAVDSVLPHDKVKIGKRGNTSKIVEADINAGAANPKLKFDVSDSKWKFANDGSTFTEIGTGSSVTTYAAKAYHDSDCSFLGNSAGSFNDFALDATCTFTQTLDENFGTITSQLSGSDKVPGIVFTPPATGIYFVCAKVFTQISSAVVGLQLTDGTTVIAQSQIRDSGGSGIDVMNAICGVYKITSLSSVTLKVQYRISAASVSILSTSGSAYTHALEWDIYRVGP